ncbi:MAG: hypothetical protein KDE14_15600 [Rhodobacteraceae bacterium]|nr:hypothetical protein [Paracoccaceae bacterium]
MSPFDAVDHAFAVLKQAAAFLFRVVGILLLGCIIISVGLSIGGLIVLVGLWLIFCWIAMIWMQSRSKKDGGLRISQNAFWLFVAVTTVSLVGLHPGLQSYWERNWLTRWRATGQIEMLTSFPVEMRISLIVDDEPISISRKFSCEQFVHTSLGSRGIRYYAFPNLQFSEPLNGDLRLIGSISTDCTMIRNHLKVGEVTEGLNQPFPTDRPGAPNEEREIANAEFGIVNKTEAPRFQIQYRNLKAKIESEPPPFDPSSLRLSFVKLEEPRGAFFPILEPVREFE